MRKKCYLIFTTVFEFGGSNSYLRLLNEFYSDCELHFVVSRKEELILFKELPLKGSNISCHILSDMLQFADIKWSSKVRSIKQLILVFLSIIHVVMLLIRLRSRRIVISSVDPEKYLYLLCIPLVMFRYITHTVPNKSGRPFSSFVCNNFLSEKKKLIAVSMYGRKELVKNWSIGNLKSRYVSVIHNAVFNEEGFLGNTWNVENSTILTLGHAVDYKNPYLWIDVAIRVTSIYPKIEFKWVGDGILFNDLVERTKGYERIHFVKGAAEVRKHFATAYLYYQPSKIESHGIAVLEAMASSVPCVVSNAGGLPESVENCFNGFVVDVNKGDEHVDAIISLIENRRMATLFSANCRSRYAQVFSFSNWRSRMKEDFVFK